MVGLEARARAVVGLKPDGVPPTQAEHAHHQRSHPTCVCVVGVSRRRAWRCRSARLAALREILVKSFENSAAVQCGYRCVIFGV